MRGLGQSPIRLRHKRFAPPVADMNQRLLVVDLQRDFLETGSAPAHSTTTLCADVQRTIDAVLPQGVEVIFSRDWHPRDHRSFVAQGGPWPAHCVQNTWGAQFGDGLQIPSNATVISKGVTRDIEGYSAFEATELRGLLEAQGIRQLAVCGISTDYCVKASVLDAISAGLSVYLLTDLVRPLDIEGGVRALEIMANSGALLHTAEQWIAKVKPALSAPRSSTR